MVNLKHYSILSSNSSAGIRRSELLNLKIKDLDSYSRSSIARVFSIALKIAAVLKRITPLLPRHRFLTHLQEEGTDTRYLQQILSLGSSKTMEIYTHIGKKSLANIQSHLDSNIESLGSGNLSFTMKKN